MNIVYSEFEYYSPFRDRQETRISVADEDGREYWTVVGVDGKGYRDRRNEAIDMCVRAIDLGCDPGEVRYA